MQGKNIYCTNMTLDSESVLFGIRDKHNKMNLLILIAKQYIYRSKCNKVSPNINDLKCILKFQCMVEEKIAHRHATIPKFENRWWLIKQLFIDD